MIVTMEYGKYLMALLILIGLMKVIPIIKKQIQRVIYEKKLEKSGIKDIDKMDGFQFEVYLKVLFQKLGYKPEVTQKAGDFGADLILKGKNRIVVQAKRYGYKNKVGISAVQEIYAAQAYYSGHEAWVVTNSTFTPQAKKLADACQVKLVDRYQLQDMIFKIQPEQTPKEIYQQVNPLTKKCPKCSNELVVRVSKKNGNKFFGCSNFPSCQHTEKIHS